MRDKKTIAYKKECTKKIAYGLRAFLREVVMQEWRNLRERKKRSKTQMERRKLDNELSSLYRALQASICECSACNQFKRDMMYNAYMERWYCTLCVQEYRDFYYEKKLSLDKGWSVGDFDVEFHKSFL